jgi:hypothetical protein
MGMPCRLPSADDRLCEKLLAVDWTGLDVPNFSTICRRQKTLAVNIPYGGAKNPQQLLPRQHWH